MRCAHLTPDCLNSRSYRFRSSFKRSSNVLCSSHSCSTCSKKCGSIARALTRGTASWKVSCERSFVRELSGCAGAGGAGDCECECVPASGSALSVVKSELSSCWDGAPSLE